MPTSDAHTTSLATRLLNVLHRRRRLFFVLLLTAAGGGLLYFSGPTASLEKLAQEEESLRAFVASSPVEAVLLGFAIYVLLAMFPGGQIKTLVYGWLFGFVVGTVMVSMAATIGACLTVFISRYLLSDLTTKYFAPRTEWLQRAIRRDGGMYLFVFRLIPSSPFSPVNWALGLTPLRLRTCWWATQLGMLPQIILFSLVGSRLPSLDQILKEGVSTLSDPSLITPLAALAILPMLIRWVIMRFRGRLTPPTTRLQQASSLQDGP